MSIAGENRTVEKKADTPSPASRCTGLQTKMLGKERGTGAREKVVCDIVVFLWVFPFSPGVLKAKPSHRQSDLWPTL